MRFFALFANVAWLAATLTHCASGDPGQLINQRMTAAFDRSVELPVYFATNRVPLNLSPRCTDEYYGVRNEGSLSFGLCPVNVPMQHAIGSLDTITSRYGDPNRYFKTGRHTELSATTLAQQLQSSGNQEALVFVHGFNVKFEEALLRAAQIAYDVKFQGDVILFTWPAGASDSLSSVLIHQTYASNQKHARESVALFQEFIESPQLSGKRLHVLVHSMGHQIVLPALAKAGAQASAPLVRELILNAPDFPGEELVKIAPRLKRAAQRTTLYCSPGDNALVASKQINSNYRAGLCMRIPGIDVINVNELDTSTLGHGYYSGRPVLTDVYQVLLGVDVQRRLFIRRSNPNGGEDYILRR